MWSGKRLWAQAERQLLLSNHVARFVLRNLVLQRCWLAGDIGVGSAREPVTNKWGEWAWIEDTWNLVHHCVQLAQVDTWSLGIASWYARSSYRDGRENLFLIPE